MEKKKHPFGHVYLKNGVSVLVAEGDGWATIYTVKSKMPNKGLLPRVIIRT